MSLKSFCITNKRLLCVIILIILGIILFNTFSSIKEGFDWGGYTPVKNNCSIDGTTCATCISSYMKYSDTNDNIRCAWNSASSSGGSCETSSATTPVGYFTCPSSDTVTKPGCTPCQKTKLLDTPTWMSV